MKDKKTTFRFYNNDELDEMAYYFNYMASQGWYFDHFSLGLTFVKGEPKDVEYSVINFNKANDFDWGPQGETMDFIEYLETGGWHFIDSEGAKCVLVKTSEDAVEIFTDEEKIEGKKEFVSKSLLCSIVVLLFELLKYKFFYSNIFNYSDLFNTTAVMNITSPLLFFVLSLYEVILYIRTVINQKHLENGEEVFLGKKYTGKPKLSLFNKLLLMIMIFAVTDTIYFTIFDDMYFIWLIILVIFGYYVLHRTYNTKKRPDRVNAKNNMFISLLAIAGICLAIVFGYLVYSSISIDAEMEREEKALQSSQVIDYPSNAPIRLDDLGVTEGLKYVDIEKDGSIFGKKTEYRFEYSEEDQASYTVYKCINTSIAKYTYDQLYDSAEEDVAIKELKLDIDHAFIDEDHYYTFQYKNIVLTINLDEELSNEQLQVIVDEMHQLAR